MSQQNYKHHIRFYPTHHFIFYPLMMILLVAGIRGFLKDDADKWYWALVAGVAFLCSWLGYMMRQHYALINQNRTVRLEMRLRYFQLTGKRLEMVEERLGFGRIAALRFASDEELPALTEKALAENLDATEIKKQIKNWLPDHMRV
ncbi:MAG: hypothetical protein EOO88_48615 [Pedobacter sp.]|nr:MAG: hypothetical protein EOO88_48615 [Pedobacter sp.]